MFISVVLAGSKVYFTNEPYERCETHIQQSSKGVALFDLIFFFKFSTYNPYLMIQSFQAQVVFLLLGL